MKKRIVLTPALLSILCLLLTACTQLVEAPPKETLLYTTFAPLQVLAKAVTKDVPKLRVLCLTDPQAGCLRAYTLSGRDAALLTASADGVLSFGSGMESFSDTLEELSESGFWLAELLPGTELYTWKKSASDEDDDHFHGANPYLYMRVSGCLTLLTSLESILSVFDPDHETLYRENAAAARAFIEALQQELPTLTAPCRGVRAAVLNEALFYCAEDYGMEIAAAVSRESGTLLYDSELEDCLAELSKSEAQVVLVESHAPKALTDALEGAGYPVIRLDTLALNPDLNALRKNAEEAARVCLTLGGKH